MRKLSEPEAWREIARRFAQGSMKYSDAGICAEMWALSEKNRLAFYATVAIGRCCAHAELSPYRDESDGALYAFPPGTHYEERILAALFLALEAEEESDV